MIPLELSLEGLFSYRGRQHLSFRPLVEAGVFGILGPTGSGKSALVEALLLALYDRCPRKLGPSITPILNRHSSRLNIDFSFRLDTATDAALYRCRYRASISPRGEVRNKQHQLYRYEDGCWVLVSSKPDEAIEELLGLDYENFCRAILLPQGKFQDFLLLSPAKRAEALEQLFHLHHYNISDTVRLELTSTKTRLQELDHRTEQLRHRASLEHQQQLRETLERLRHEAEEHQHRIRELEAAERQLSRLQSLWEEYERVCAQLHTLEQQEPAERQRLRLLRCCLTLQPRWGQLQHLQLEILRTEDELHRHEQAAEDLRRQVESLQPQYEQMRRDYHERYLLQERQRSIHDALRSLELNTEHQRLTTQLQQTEHALHVLQSQKDSLRDQLRTHQQRSLQLAEELRTCSFPPELSQWYAKNQRLAEDYQQTLDELDRLRERERRRVEEVLSRLPDTVHPTSVEDIPTLLEALDSAAVRLRVRLEQRRCDREALLRQQTAAELARFLTPGLPCPVCGSPSHPQPCTPDPAAEARLQELSHQLEELEHTLYQLDALSTELRSRHDELAHRREQLRQHLHQLQHEQHRHRQVFCWEGWDPDRPDRLDELQHHHAELQAELHHCSQEEARLQQLLDQLTHTEHDLLREHAHLHAQLKSSQAECERLRQQLPAPLASLSAEQLRAELQHLQEHQRYLEEEYPRLEQRYTELRQNYERLQLECEHLRARLSELRAASQHHWETLRHQCTTEGLSWEDVITTLRNEPHPSAALQQLQHLEEQRTLLRRRRQELEDLAQRYNPEEHTRLREELEQTRALATELQQQLGQYREQLATLERELDEYERLRREQTTLATRSRLLEELERLFRGRAFIHFLAHEYLRTLCRHANTYFQQWTHGLLALEVDEKAQLNIRDLSHGGLYRPVQTLSGGQLFQASLAMALALSDMTRASARLRQCLFFIDEGFGNLDRNSLALVMDTLRQLRRHGRLVGVISHREELQQELDSYVHILHDHKHGSRIESAPYQTDAAA